MFAKGKIYLVSGEIESGKTRFCRDAADYLKEKGWDTAGLLAPAVFEGGRKTAIEALDLRSGDVRRLADLNELLAGGNGPRTARWHFHADVLEWCNQVLKSAVPCDLLVVDELGPLELERNEGMLAGFEAIDSGLYQLSLTVVRPSLLDKALGHWQGAEVVKIGELTDPSISENEWFKHLMS
jgi:nucleoside-triphosphatase THEP1